jgi:hypothetical protein
VDKVSVRQLFEGEIQHMMKLLPAPLREGSSSLVSFESLKGMWEAFSESLEMQLVSWKRDLLMYPAYCEL